MEITEKVDLFIFSPNKTSKNSKMRLGTLIGISSYNISLCVHFV